MSKIYRLIGFLVLVWVLVLPFYQGMPIVQGAPPKQTPLGFSTSGMQEAVAIFEPPIEAGNLFITHSTSQSIVQGNSVNCSAGGVHAENSFYRVYNLPIEFGISNPISIDEITFGIEMANAPGGHQPVTVNLYTLSGPFLLENLTLIGSEFFSIPNQNLTIFSAAISPEVVVPADSILVVEVRALDGLRAQNRFLIGTNTGPQTSPSYIRAPECGVLQPTDLGLIGFPNAHFVMNVSAELLPLITPTSGPSPTPTATSTPTSTATPTVPISTATPTPPPHLYATPGVFNEIHPTAPQITTDTLIIGNHTGVPLAWTIAENNTGAGVDSLQIDAPTAQGSTRTTSPYRGAIIVDGSFETGTPNAGWDEFSTNFGTPLCDYSCGHGGGSGEHSGFWWAWFGGTTYAETGILTQTVTIPVGSAALHFWLEIPARWTNGFLSVQLDGTEIFRAEETTTGYDTYTEVVVDISAYADGNSHELVFFSSTDSGSDFTSFFVDDVQIVADALAGCPTPSDLSWLTVSPTSGTLAGSGVTSVTLTFDSTGLPLGIYTGTLCVVSDEPGDTAVPIPVTLEVVLPTVVDLDSFQSVPSLTPLLTLVGGGFLALMGAAMMRRRR